MMIEELADKLMDKSAEAYQEHCTLDEGESEDDDGFIMRKRYWEGWSDALEWVGRSIRDGCLCNFGLKRPICIGHSWIGGVKKNYFKYPEGWSDEQKDEWRMEHGG